jgi:hypothetical protein
MWHAASSAECRACGRRFPDGRKPECRVCVIQQQRKAGKQEAKPASAATALPSEKRCSRCSSLLPAERFHLNRCSSDGLHNWCKDCVSAQQKVGRPDSLRKWTASCASMRQEVPSTANAERVVKALSFADLCSAVGVSDRAWSIHRRLRGRILGRQMAAVYCLWGKGSRRMSCHVSFSLSVPVPVRCDGTGAVRSRQGQQAQPSSRSASSAPAGAAVSLVQRGFNGADRLPARPS